MADVNARVFMRAVNNSAFLPSGLTSMWINTAGVDPMAKFFYDQWQGDFDLTVVSSESGTQFASDVTRRGVREFFATLTRNLVISDKESRLPEGFEFALAIALSVIYPAKNVIELSDDELVRAFAVAIPLRLEWSVIRSVLDGDIDSDILRSMIDAAPRFEVQGG
jgi:hypothetical protein